ncbi:MAG: RagB/SusD family nutrient uptake outer membrane protein [Gemmatimonadota bacterium]|jgi:hypothetical protein|nr:MAG: RagB/SusD family nutrient uptake outer membrane protein [Gemmatimonadota bacterium]
MRKLGSRYQVGGRRPLALLLLLPVLAVFPGCSLDENPTSVITPDNYFQNEEEILGGLAQVYWTLSRPVQWNYYNVTEVSSDEIVIPTRGQDWFDNGRWLQIHQHQWTANNNAGLDGDGLNGAWNELYGGIADANILLAGLETVTVSDKEIYVAEARALRAIFYWLLQDLFGGVPLATDTEIAPRPRATRAEIFNFVEQELIAARADLPASWPANMNGRVTTGAVDAVLASLYLNAEVFTGTVTTGGLQRGQARWQDAIDAAERVINSGQYSLELDWTRNFAPDNHLSSELILVSKNLSQAGLGGSFPYRALHYNQLTPTPWNGFATLAETYFKFDLADDLRADVFLVGPQVNLDTGEPITDRQGNPLVYTPTIADIFQASEAEGVRIYKWPADPGREGGDWNHSNDVGLFRLAEMYLIQAEALNELGNTGLAVDLVNMIRERVFEPDKPLNAADYNQDTFRDRILNERLYELIAEGKRRQDLIRHDKFTDPWEFKPQSEPYKILMVIPQTQLDINPDLTQNPGY